MEILDSRIQRIAKEIQECGATEWTVAKIIKTLSEDETLGEKKLREKALEQLKILDEEAAFVYEKFSKMKVYTSNEKIVNFNRGNIVESLLKETAVPKSVAEKITEEVENQIKDSKVEIITPSLIRELVNAKLIVYGFENVRNDYTRVGSPIFDVKKIIQKKPLKGEEAREYHLISIIPKTSKKMHYNSTIFIEDIEGFSSRAFAYSTIAEKKETIEKTIAESFAKAERSEEFFTTKPSIYGLTFACAEFVGSEQKAKKCAEIIKAFSSVQKEKSVISLELYSPKSLKNMAGKKINASKISNHLISEKNSVICVDSEYCLKLINSAGKNFEIINCSHDEEHPLANGLFSPTRGISLFINLNLEKLVQQKDEEKFFKKLEEACTEINLLAELKKKLLEEREYLKEFNVSEFKNGLGVTNFSGVAKKIGAEKPSEFMSKLQKELTKNLEGFLFFPLFGEKAKKRFSEEVSYTVESQDVMPLEECLEKKKCCFSSYATNQKELSELINGKVKKINFVGKK